MTLLDDEFHRLPAYVPPPLPVLLGRRGPSRRPPAGAPRVPRHGWRRSAVAGLALLIAGTVLATLVARWRDRASPDGDVASTATIVWDHAGLLQHLQDPFTGTVATPGGTLLLAAAKFELRMPQGDSLPPICTLHEGEGTWFAAGAGDALADDGVALPLGVSVVLDAARPGVLSVAPANPAPARPEGSDGSEESSRQPLADAGTMRDLWLRAHTSQRHPGSDAMLRVRWNHGGTVHEAVVACDTNGNARLRVPQDATAFEVRADGDERWARGEWGALNERLGRAADQPAHFVVHELRKMAGRVLDAAERPVAGAAVLWLAREPRTLARAHLGTPGAPGPGAACTFTDDQGVFELREVGGSVVCVQAFAGGTVSQLAAVLAAEAQNVELRLQRATAIQGVVVLATGEPAAGGTIECRVRTEGAAQQVQQLVRVAAVDGSGAFALDDLPLIEGVHATLVYHDGDGRPRARQRVALLPQSFEVRVLVEPAGSIRGRVLDGDDRPAAATVVARDAELGELGHAQTDADGWFRLDDLPPACPDLLVVPQDPRWASRSVPQVLAASEPRPLHVRLSATGAICGRLVDRAGAPMRGRTVVAVPVLFDDPGAYGSAEYAVTDDDGAFAIAGLPLGLYRLRAVAGPKHVEARTGAAHVLVPYVR